MKLKITHVGSSKKTWSDRLNQPVRAVSRSLPKPALVEGGTGIVRKRALWKSASPWQGLRRFRERSDLLFTSLRPRMNRVLPVELQSESVGLLVEGLPEGIRDDGFERLVTRIDTGPIHHGNEVQLFFRGEEALDSVCREIENATEEVLLETYILRDDATGRKILKLLAGAVARGVRVRVLVDAYGSWSTKSSFWREMQNSGIEARRFHPFWSHLKSFFFRDHRKIIVVDRRVSFTGGMNVANEYGSSRHHQNTSWRDTHVRIEGPTSWEMALVFNEGWERAGGKPLQIPSLAPTNHGGAKTLVLDSCFGRGHDETAAVLAALVAGARKRLWITNSYFAPNQMAIRLLKRAAQRGVDVRLLLQGQTDMPLVHYAGHGNYSELLAGGVKIFEYQSAILHAKTLVVDDYASVIGSSNLDFRSFYFNAECNVLIFDEMTGETMAQQFQEDLKQSTEIRLETWSRRPLLHRLRDILARSLSPLF